MSTKKKVIIIICYLAFVLGLTILLYDYFVDKKNLAFETINMEINGNKTPEFKETAEEGSSDISNDSSAGTNDTTNQKAKKNPTRKKDYIGYLEIKKIGLYKGFVNKNSSLNNVDYNLQIINPSDYPDVDNGNFIIAAHSGNSSIAYFKNLYKLQNDDQVTIYYKNIKYTYTINDIYTQPKTGSVNIYRDKNVTTLTLITCTKNDNTTQTIYIASLTSKE